MVLCFDIGGTSIKYGVASVKENTICFFGQKTIPTNAKEIKGMGIVQRVLEIIFEMEKSYSLSGIAVSTAGIVDNHKGSIIYANENIPKYTGCCLKNIIEQSCHLPCTVENDVNCAALGETIYGAGKGANSVLCMTVGTGIGGAIVLNQKIWSGSKASAGEIGYLPMEGKIFEELASTSALIKRVYQKTGKMMDGKQIFECAKNGNEVCVTEINEMCRTLAKGIASCVCLLDPEVVILGGGVMTQGDYLRPIVSGHLQTYLPEIFLEHSRFEFAQLGNDAGMAGAFYWFQCNC